MSGQSEKIIGGFRILQELQAGSGSQGTVYKAVCEDDRHGLVAVGTVVALKVMPVQDGEGAQWRKLQKRTAELARLDHPNVVRYYGCFSEEGLFNDVHVVVQEFLQGETLKESLARKKTGLDVDEGLRVVDATLAGLDYMAQRGIVHRDLKPGNIFLCDDGGVKLIDFEIAKQEGGTVTASVGNIRGSFDYMAPDFTNPEFHGDVQSDVFSMGVVLHEVLSGKTPYKRLEGDDKQANFAFLSRWSQTLSSGHSPIHISSRIRSLLAHADEVLLRALAPKRRERFQDFSSFREGLKSIRFRSLKNGDASYQLLQFIGKGGFGEVFKARERRTGQLVAVKHLLKAAYAERFYREAKIMRKIGGSCFVQLVDFFVLESSGGREAFLVMAFLDGMPGSSLRDAIRRRSEAPMEWRDVFVAFARYAQGLLAIHQQGIYHRDIKPSNLYYPDGRPEEAAIMDLGIARDVNGTATTGQVPGTLDYMPPEVVISDSRGDGGMDIYALGLCFYEALTGRMAFPRLPSGTTAYAAFFERAKAKRSPSFDAPEVQGDEEILSLLKDMTNPDASRRLKNAGILLKRLGAIIDSRFGGDADNEAATIATTIAMPSGDSATVATSAIGGQDAVAIEREKQRMVKTGKTHRKFFLLTIATLLLTLAGATVYQFRAMIAEKLAFVMPAKEKPPKPDNPGSEIDIENQGNQIAALEGQLAQVKAELRRGLVDDLESFLAIDDSKLDVAYIADCSNRLNRACDKLEDMGNRELLTEKIAGEYEEKISRLRKTLEMMKSSLQRESEKKTLVNELDKLLKIDEGNIDASYIENCEKQLDLVERKLNDRKPLLSEGEFDSYEKEISTCRGRLKEMNGRREKADQERKKKKAIVDELSGLLVEFDDKRNEGKYVRDCRTSLIKAARILKDGGSLLSAAERNEYENAIWRRRRTLDEMDAKSTLKDEEKRVTLIGELSAWLMNIDDTRVESEYIRFCSLQIDNAAGKLKDKDNRELLTEEIARKYDEKVSRLRETLDRMKGSLRKESAKKALVNELDKLLKIDEGNLDATYIADCNSRLSRAADRLKDRENRDLLTEQMAKKYAETLLRLRETLDRMKSSLQRESEKKALADELRGLLNIDLELAGRDKEYVEDCNKRLAEVEAKLRGGESLLSPDEIKVYKERVAANKNMIAVYIAKLDMVKRENTAKDLASKAGFYYESEDYYETVKYYREAVKNGYSMEPDEMQRFEDAYMKALEYIRKIKSASVALIEIRPDVLRRNLNELDAKIKNLVDWHFDVTRR